jgi:FdrA protein
LQALDEDPETKVIVLVSKPPAAEVAEKVLAAAEASKKPVVVIFLGVDPATITRNGVHGAWYLGQAAEMAVAISKGEHPVATIPELPNEIKRTLSGLARSMAKSQRYVRGIFCGGTFCFGAQLVFAKMGITSFSNTPTNGNSPLVDNWKSQENTFVDMGDDAFTQGRPHPMIDPSLRDARIREEVDDPTTAVVLFDVVLGYGSADDPTAGLLGAIGSTKAKAKAAGRSVAFICYVCGTDMDPQDRNKIVAGLKAAGVLIAASNAEAAAWAAAIILERQGAKS